ncbi:DUF2238 domain-containing protein [Peptacetobacter sp.]|uniref:DUF2238 domain-containing protein n=1 Tax=Peptacetobacter sp. TaxID=2991975 RepID=UPI00261A9192|nr:DUF2238 domain-containing protein [Peptacetobacter sp.]
MNERKYSFKKISTIILSVFFAISLIYFLYTKDSMGISVCIFGLILIPILYKINKSKPKLLTDELYCIFIWYTCIASILGSGYGLYSINHYDDFLHFVSGILTVIVACTILKYFNTKEQLKEMNLIFIVIFILMFSMGVASFWEIGEYSMDHILHTNTQVGGLTDTIMDMIDAFLGCVISILYVVRKIKNQK